MNWQRNYEIYMSKLIVRKANDLVEAKTHLSLAERKAFAISVAFVKKVIGNNAISEIDFQVLKSYLGAELNVNVDREFKRRLKKILEGLKSKKELALVEIPVGNYIRWLKDNSKEEWIQKLDLESLGEEGLILCGVIDSIALSPKFGKIIVTFNAYITPLIIELKKRYTSYELKYILLLDLKHSPILYELFKKNEKLGKFKISLDELRKKLGVDDKPTYKVWGNFLKKILIPALDEINEKTDISVDFQTEKGNFGKVINLIFFITPKNRVVKYVDNLASLLKEIVTSFHQAEENITVEEFAEVLLSLQRVNPAVALWFLLHYPEGEPRLYAWEHIRMTEQNLKIKHPDRYLESLIRDKNSDLDWLLDQRTKDLIRKKLEKIAKPLLEKRKEQEQELEIKQMVEEIVQIAKSLSEKYKQKLKETLGVANFREYLLELAQKKDVAKLQEIYQLVAQLSEENWKEEFGEFQG